MCPQLYLKSFTTGVIGCGQPETEKEGDGVGLGPSTNKKTIRKKKQVSDTRVDIQVDGTQVSVLCPKFRGEQASSTNKCSTNKSRGLLQGGPLQVINRVITPINGLINR